MNRRATLRWSGLVLAAVVLGAPLWGGCGDDRPRFEAPSEDEMRDRVHLEATATLDESSLPWAWEQTRYAASFATAFLRFTEVYAATFASGGALSSSGLTGIFLTGDGFGVSESALTYTASGYIKFSCPGGDLAAPDYEFTGGNARVESPGIVREEDITTLESGAVFLLRFLDGCEVGDDVLGGDVYGLFETPWVLVADVLHEMADGQARRVRADIELAANRLTIVLYDDNDDRFKVVITHPEGAVTSARFEGKNAKCDFGVQRDPASGGYVLSDALPRCEF